jgi:UDP-N-acetylglucosamine--N-acetylmuramyl-(pentapeptide) pyrophosphoryl-undecaprenol N-acetylglucosamine transferase
VKVVIAGGGTGGHVFPGLALADRLRGDHGASVEFIGSPAGPESRLVPEAGYPFHPVDAAPFYRELSLRAVRAPFVALRSVRSSRPLLVDAAALVGVGGYVSVPPGLAARRARVPLILHEQNAVPSLANRLLARRAVSIGLTFEDARDGFPRRSAATVTGDPVRASILRVRSRREELAGEARATFAFETTRTTVVAFGGSQGALHLDEAIAGALPILAHRHDLQLLVLSGPEHVGVVERARATTEAGGGAMRVCVMPFLDRMELAYAVADLAVTRAGATSIAEMAVCGVPMILVPYPYATENHQLANAAEMVRAGAAELQTDRELSSDGLARRILELVDDGERRAEMARASAAWGKPDADAHLASLVLEAAR